VFLDRDGTLNARPRPHEYVTTVTGFTWLPGAVEGVARLARAGYVLTVVSNQRGVARGLVTRATLHAIEERIQTDLMAHGCAIQCFRYCFHDGAERCRCRKPAPGMILDLAREFDLELSTSWVIGDTESDIQAGIAAGCRTALLGDPRGLVEPDLVAGSLAEASVAIARPAGGR
jgi:D-glycero-D-manno-heptose 1,7-bisphosphate phosphatase